MKVIFAVILLFSSVFTFAEVISITSPINYQTVYDKQGSVKIRFRVNATTLANMPKYTTLYINNMLSGKTNYKTSGYFDVSDMPDGTYEIIIIAVGHTGKAVAMSNTVKFNMRKQGYVVKK